MFMNILARIVVFLALSSAFVAQTPIQAQEAKPPTVNYAAPIDNTKPQTVKHELILEAKLTDNGNAIEKGLLWRIYSARENSDGKLNSIGSGKGGTSSFSLPAGTYLVHASFGRAGATKRITLARGSGLQTFVLNAGGLKLNAIAGNQKITNPKLRFSIYSQSEGNNAKPKAIARGVSADKIVRLNAGTYHIISEYGDINATVRADIRVSAGQLTEATLQHRAAQITLKLVSEKGGEAIADTHWSIVSNQGAEVKESNSTFPTMVLASGSYTALARNGGEVFKQDFTVSAGANGDVEVLAKK
jgi:hypothetical protein